MHIVKQDSGSAEVGGKHVVVDGDKHFDANGRREVCCFALVHVANQSLLFAKIAAPVDGEQGDVDMQAA